jgi:hypothetical protein
VKEKRLERVMKDGVEVEVLVTEEEEQEDDELAQTKQIN